MSDEAATPSGGAEAPARPETSTPSVQDRIKSAIFATTEPEADPERKAPIARPNEAKPNEQVEGDDAPTKQEGEADDDEPKEDATEEEQQEQTFETIDELAAALGWDLDKIAGLAAKTKIDGKEGKATLRDLIKSYQLEGHLNQKLMTHAEEKKAFEAERQNFLQQSQHKLSQMDAAVQVATKFLQGEFAQVNWQQLSETDPAEFNRQYVLFQQRQAILNNIANQLGQERQQSEQQAAANVQAYLAEQMKLLESKVPEWGTKEARDKALSELGAVFSEAYGISPQELGGVSDHRMLLVARDAWQWQKLQKAKPTVVNKVKNAPKLLKPGTQQSKAATSGLQLQNDMARLKRTGKPSDAKPVFKKLLFG